MAEHSAEELKRQMDNARGKMDAARRDYNEASRRYEDKCVSDSLADYERRGITPGCVVLAFKADQMTGQMMHTKCGFLGVEYDRFSGARPILSTLKKNGQPSASKRYIPCDHLEAFNDT